MTDPGLELNVDVGKSSGVTGDAEVSASLELPSAGEIADDLNLEDDAYYPDSADLPPLPVTMSFSSPPSSDADAENGSVYDFTVKDLDGNDVSLSKYK